MIVVLHALLRVLLLFNDCCIAFCIACFIAFLMIVVNCLFYCLLVRTPLGDPGHLLTSTKNSKD